LVKHGTDTINKKGVHLFTSSLVQVNRRTKEQENEVEVIKDVFSYTGQSIENR
jgi:hypothetical protein